MCRERKYRANCRQRHVNSYSPRIWVLCIAPDFPRCVSSDPVIDVQDVRDHTCKACVKRILPARPSTPPASNNLGQVLPRIHKESNKSDQTDAAVLPTDLAAALPKDIPGLDGYGSPRPSPPWSRKHAMRSKVASADTQRLNEAYEGPLSPFGSPTGRSSSSQETGIVYTEEGKKYPYTVYDVNAEKQLEYEGEVQMWDELLDDAAREEMGEDYYRRRKVTGYITGVQKKRRGD